MKKIVRNLLVFNLLAPFWLGAQVANEVSFFGKNLHEIRELAHPVTARRPLLASLPTIYFTRFELEDWLLAGTPTTARPAEPTALFSKKRNLPPGFCAADLAFFCRLELKMDKALRTPVRFRLGSQEYVDWLERKSSARFMDFR